MFAAYFRGLAVCGSLEHCIFWGRGQLSDEDHNAVVKILRVRPQEDAHIIADLTLSGCIFLQHKGRQVPKRELRKALRNGEEKK